MSTDLEQQLREALRQDAQRARLVNPDGPPAPEARPLVSVDNRQRSLPKLVAAAAVIAFLVAAAVARFDDDHHVDTVPPVTDAQVFTDIPPGSTVALPPAPISPLNGPAVVWTGTELIVWAGVDAGGATLDDGAAFAPATGTWRLIAPAPVEPRSNAAAAWTGTEMVVWGGQTDDASGAGPLDGAAYNPTTDTWRLLPEGPFDSWAVGLPAMWTGDEFVVIGVEADPRAENTPMAAYDPATDEWRRIADAPPGFEFDPVWTGEAILTTVTTSSTTSQVMRYDQSSDTWQAVDELASGDVSLIAVPDSRVVLALQHDTGAPLVVLDPSGTTIGTMPALPADARTVGDRHASSGVVVGEEVLFSIGDLESDEAPDRWALNLATQTWRPLEANEGPPVSYDLTWVPEAGVLIGWTAVPEPGGPSSIAYRPPTPVGD